LVLLAGNHAKVSSAIVLLRRNVVITDAGSNGSVVAQKLPAGLSKALCR
jgi:hypothetical protein